jgi:hypothetical protein
MAASQFPVTHGELIISKSQGLLAGAETVELSYVPQQETDVYEISKNARIGLTKEEDQVVDVMLVAKTTGTIAVVVGRLPDTTQLKLRAIHADTNAAYALSPTESTTVPTGKYKIRAWSDGYRLAVHETTVVKDKRSSVEIVMEKAPSYRIQVLDHAGKVVAGAAVLPIYSVELGIPRKAQESDRVGQASVAIDDRLDVRLAVITPASGARVFPLSPKWRDEVGKIELTAPCEAIGEVGIAKALVSDVHGAGRWSVMWVPSGEVKVVVYGSRIVNSKYSGILQPGEYIDLVALFDHRSAIDFR